MRDMTQESILKIKQAIKNVCKMEKESGYIDEVLAKDEFDLAEELGFDSLLFVELVVEIETELDFEFDMKDLDTSSFKKWSSLKNVIERYLC